MSTDNPADEGEDQGKYTELAKQYAGFATLDLIKAMAAVQARKEKGEEVMKQINLELDFLRLVAIPGRFEEEGIENMKVDGIGRVGLTGDMFVSILASNKEAAYEFFRDIGKGSLIQNTIPSSTLKATVKAMMKAGETIPEDLIKITPFTRASITKR